MFLLLFLFKENYDYTVYVFSCCGFHTQNLPSKPLQLRFFFLPLKRQVFVFVVAVIIIFYNYYYFLYNFQEVHLKTNQPHVINFQNFFHLFFVRGKWVWVGGVVYKYSYRF